MLGRSFQVNSYGMGFGIADILHRVCYRITPNSFSRGSSFLFSFAVGWGFIGVITGVIPMILLAALFGSAGRTM